MKVKVKVTQEDIDKGLPNSGMLCPIARALGRAVSRNIVYVFHDGSCAFRERIYFRLPKSAANFVSNFDDGRPVAPFSFSVDVDLK